MLQSNNLLKSIDVDIKLKVNVFSTSIISQFLLDADSSTPYWIVRKTIVCLAYYGELRQTEKKIFWNIISHNVPGQL